MTQQEQQEIKVIAPGQLIGGVYCNFMQVSHSKEEFIMDFLMFHRGQGALTSRVIMSPGHMKRTIAALQNNLKKYESEIGRIEEAPPPKGKLGFQSPKSS